MVDAIDAWVDVIFFAVAAASSATAPAELNLGGLFAVGLCAKTRCMEQCFRAHALPWELKELQAVFGNY